MHAHTLDDISAETRDAYWLLVRRTVVEVFGADPAVVDRYRQAFDASPPAERLLAYHQQPLGMAADLCDGKATAEACLAYATIASEPSFAVLDDNPGTAAPE